MAGNKRVIRGRKAFRKGRWIEWCARMYLRLKGYRIVERNIKPYDTIEKGVEIDIVAQKGRLLAFVEVKYRPTYQEAMDALPRGLVSRLNNAAAYFISRAPEYAECDICFDVLLFTPYAFPKHIKNIGQ